MTVRTVEMGEGDAKGYKENRLHFSGWLSHLGDLGGGGEGFTPCYMFLLNLLVQAGRKEGCGAFLNSL